MDLKIFVVVIPEKGLDAGMASGVKFYSQRHTKNAWQDGASQAFFWYDNRKVLTGYPFQDVELAPLSIRVFDYIVDSILQSASYQKILGGMVPAKPSFGMTTKKMLRPIFV